MKTEVRLGSVAEYGVGGPECTALDLIYMHMLHEFGQDLYRRIGINQIGEDLKEFIEKDAGNKIHVNIRYPTTKEFHAKSVDEKNKIRLNVIHEALIRVAKFEGKLDISKLEAIRSKILTNDFSFFIVRKTFLDKKYPNMSIKLIIHPLVDRFDYYALVEENQNIRCQALILQGSSALFTGDDFFFYGKWVSKNEFVFSGKKKEVEAHLHIEKCNVSFVNLTSYSNPPFFTSMNINASDKQKEQATKDWWHSLPPAIASAISQSDN